MREDTFADILDDRRQFIGAYMRMCLIEHRIGCTEEMEKFHHSLHVSPFLGAGEEFAIRERTCPTFAEAVVRLRVKSFVAVEECDVFLAFADLFAPFIDDGFDAVLQEREGRKESCGACSDDNGGALGIMYILKDRRRI